MGICLGTNHFNKSNKIMKVLEFWWAQNSSLDEEKDLKSQL